PTSSTAKMRIERRAHPRRRKIPMAVAMPHPANAARTAAIVQKRGFKGIGVSGGGSIREALEALKTIDPATRTISRLPSIASTALTRTPTDFDIAASLASCMDWVQPSSGDNQSDAPDGGPPHRGNLALPAGRARRVLAYASLSTRRRTRCVRAPRDGRDPGAQRGRGCPLRHRIAGQAAVSRRVPDRAGG